MESARAARECLLRSPLSWLANAPDLPIDISTGIHDGHTGSVPVSHTFNAFNVLAADKDKVSEEDIDYVVKNEAIPEHLVCNEVDPAFGEHKVLFRRVSNNVRLTIFDGNHDLYEKPALEWLSRQVKDEAIDWAPGPASAAAPDSVSAKLSS